MPHLCALPEEARLADIVLPKQQGPPMRFPVSPTGNSSGWAAASRQSKTLKHTQKKDSCFSDQKSGHLPLLCISFKRFGRIPDR